MANEFIIKNGFISKGDGEINGSFYSNGSSATGTTSFAFGNLNTVGITHMQKEAKRNQVVMPHIRVIEL